MLAVVIQDELLGFFGCGLNKLLKILGADALTVLIYSLNCQGLRGFRFLSCFFLGTHDCAPFIRLKRTINRHI